MKSIKNTLEGETHLHKALEDNPPRGNFKPLLLADFMAIKFEEAKWLVEDLIPAGGIVAVSGAPASYKTWFILNMALSVTQGTPLFDRFQTEQGNVLLIDEENDGRTLQERFIVLEKKSDLQLHVLSLYEFMLTPKMVKDLILYAKKHNIKLVIFDSLVRIHASEENSATDMAKVTRLLKRIAKEDIAVVFTHHNRKPGPKQFGGSQEMRGSSDILASVDAHLTIDRKQGENTIVVNQKKMRQAPEIKPFNLTLLSDDSGVKFKYEGEQPTTISTRDQCKENIESILKETDRPLAKKEMFDLIKSEVKGGYSTFRTALNEMVTDGKLFEKKGSKHTTLCSLVPFEEVEQINM